MVEKLITARRAVDMFDWADGRQYDLVSGRGTVQPSIAKSPTAYACMNIRGQELANIPWHIKQGDRILESHPLIDMLTDFGPESNYQKGMLNTELDMLIYGAALWLRDVDILKRLDPDTIKVNKTKAGLPKKKAFTQTINDKEEHFDRDEIIYFREYHPEDQLGFGIPTIQVCKKSIAAEIEALLMIEAYFRNDAVPGLLLSSDQDVPEKEANRVIAWMNKKFRGSRNKAKLGVLGRGLKPVPVGHNMREAQVIEILEYSVADICKTFRVDRKLVGSGPEATYENLAESRKFFIEDVMMPRATEYQNVINQDLVPQVDSSVMFEFAWDEMQILQEDSTLKEARLAAGVAIGAITVEYYNEEMGYPAGSKPEKEPDKESIAESKWEKKAVKAILRGDSPAVDFETDNISIDRQYLLNGRLSNAKTEEAVKACFR